MKKRILCAAIALLTLAALTGTVCAADPNVRFGGGLVHNRAFAADSSGRIVALADDYYDNGVDFIPFGETAYYPVLGGEWQGDSQEDGNLRNDSGLMGSNLNFWVGDAAAVRSAAISKSWSEGGTMVAADSIRAQAHSV
jgi:hypothetical protein